MNRIFGFRPMTAAALIDYCGSASAVFDMKKEELGQILGPYSKYTDMIGDAAIEEAEKEIYRAGKEGIVFIGRNEEAFPQLLAECEDCPAGIYVRSPSPGYLNRHKDYVSIVGTRKVSDYGKDWCRKIIEAMARSGAGPVIVSGLAYGTDITAHMAALDNGLDTIAVMATGVDLTYPALHRRQARRIAETGASALISDYPLGTGAQKINFIRRNRIIAGMSRVTVLIESGIRGGGMITARQAFSYNREVYALPGRADDPLSAGCNLLIRSSAAVPVISEKDILESLGYDPSGAAERKPESTAARYKDTLDNGEIAGMTGILSLVKRHGHISLQEISEMSGMEYRMVAELAGILENDGLIRIDIMQRCSINGKNI